MTFAVILFLLALVFFGLGVVVKGLFWLIVIGGVLLIAAVASEVHGRIRR